MCTDCDRTPCVRLIAKSGREAEWQERWQENSAIVHLKMNRGRPQERDIAWQSLCCKENSGYIRLLSFRSTPPLWTVVSVSWMLDNGWLSQAQPVMKTMLGCVPRSALSRVRKQNRKRSKENVMLWQWGIVLNHKDILVLKIELNIFWRTREGCLLM